MLLNLLLHFLKKRFPSVFVSYFASLLYIKTEMMLCVNKKGMTLNIAIIFDNSFCYCSLGGLSITSDDRNAAERFDQQFHDGRPSVSSSSNYFTNSRTHLSDLQRSSQVFIWNYCQDSCGIWRCQCSAPAAKNRNGMQFACGNTRASKGLYWERKGNSLIWFSKMWAWYLVNKVNVQLGVVCEQLSDNKLMINKAVKVWKFWITVSVLNTAHMYKQTNYRSFWFQWVKKHRRSMDKRDLEKLALK